MDRWRGRHLAGLAVVVLLLGLTAAVAARDGGERWIVVRDATGAELTRAVLPATGEFAMRYRNSVYESLAEEHFQVAGDHLRLVELRADELAVLEEYYTAVGASHSAGPRAWSIAVERPPIALPLRVQGTELGQRTLLTESGEIELWRLVAGRDDTLVILSVERAE
jgi:hypothetical protein